MPLSFGVLFLFGVITGIGAQTVDLQEISVKKNRPDEIFYKASTELVFWICDNVGSFEFMNMEDSRLEIFEDDKGLDLLEAHNKTISSWEEKVSQLADTGRYVSMGRSRDFLSAEGLDEDDGVTGFYLNVESWALPSNGATSLHVAGLINYVVSLEVQEEESFPDIIPVGTTNFYINEYKIEFSDISIDKDIVYFTLNSNLPITDVVFFNKNKDQVSELLYTMNGNPVMEMEEEYFNSALRLVVTYKKTKILFIEFDEIVGLGL